MSAPEELRLAPLRSSSSRHPQPPLEELEGSPLPRSSRPLGSVRCPIHPDNSLTSFVSWQGVSPPTPMTRWNLHATTVRNGGRFWKELYSRLSIRLESQNGAIALIVNQSWEKVRRPSVARHRRYSCVFLRLVHGSLARAGKVKSQTPKVEPQEKKKIPKGRAKKRMLYNRRYVLSPPTPLRSAGSPCILGLSMSPPYNRVENDECEFDFPHLGLVPLPSVRFNDESRKSRIVHTEPAMLTQIHHVFRSYLIFALSPYLRLFVAWC